MENPECKRHTNHKLLPGVCPSCLRERLQQFHNQSPNSDRSDFVFAFSSSSSSSSEFFFSGDSRRQRRHDHRRNASEMGTGSTTTVTVSADLFGREKLKKSGSIGMLAAGRGKNKGGFWSKLFCRPKSLFFHSKT